MRISKENKYRKQVAKIALLLCLVFFKCNSQTLTFKDFFKKINIDSKVSTITSKSKVKKVSGFNFLKLKPIEGEINKYDYYDLYYNKSNEVVKIKRINKSNHYLNYSIFFKKREGFIEMIIKLEEDESPLNLIIINYDKEELFTIKTTSNPLNNINTIEEVNLLNDSLGVVNKLNFHKGNLLLFSIIKQKEDIRLEKMLIYKDFYDKDNLNHLSFRQFITMLNIGKIYDNITTLTARPFQKKDVPLFFFNSSYH